MRTDLESTDADVLVATNPALVLGLARMGSHRSLRMAQEHFLFRHRPHQLRESLKRYVPLLDAVMSVGEQDAERQRGELRSADVHVTSTPHCVPAPAHAPSLGRSKIVTAAGRLSPLK
ncbi:hypothetical protein [Streptomyces xanthochromogenes]|uniref:hypothetical protein n=1 Tax=Streptomyces xanthochromogenes TaxID=67384 RepID=UPI0034301416